MIGHLARRHTPNDGKLSDCPSLGCSGESLLMLGREARNGARAPLPHCKSAHDGEKSLNSDPPAKECSGWPRVDKSRRS